MAKNIRINVVRRSIGWGVFLLLIAALVLANQLGDFVELGFWHIIVSALSVAFLVSSLIDLNFGALPVPLAALYFVFQDHLGLPRIDFWPLVLVTLLVSAGLTALLPKKKWFKKKKRKNSFYVDISDDDGESRFERRVENAVENVIEGVGEVVGATVEKSVEGAMDGNGNSKMKVEESGDDNNPSISVSFGGISRYLHSTALETADLSCNFGSLEVYFDNATLSPNGADIDVSCNFGSVELFVPKSWTVTGNLKATLGAAEIDGMKKQPDDGPELRINGNVSFGAIEVNRV
ncbi:MAG: hypothetical protein FWC13_01580 [Oscillospiraceae bacterium]|nr:hypothetical protein [Oscillospiraceae bacterium]